MRRSVRSCRLVSTLLLLLLLAMPDSARAGFEPLPGYRVSKLDVPYDPAALNVSFGVSPAGRLVIATTRSIPDVPGSARTTIELFNTYKSGRNLLASTSFVAGINAWRLTDFAFDGENSVVFGDNGLSDTLYRATFALGSNALTMTRLADEGAFPSIQGVALTDRGDVLVSGSTAALYAPGGLYLKSFTPVDGSIKDIHTNVGTGYIGGTGLSPRGAMLLLDTGNYPGPGILRQYRPGGVNSTLALDGGGGTGAYAIAFDPSGVAYVTTGDRITRISDLDRPDAIVDSFGQFTGQSEDWWVFLSNIAFTGQSFAPGGDGALIFANGGFGPSAGLYAITVPEPGTLGMLMLGLFPLLWARKGR